MKNKRLLVKENLEWLIKQRGTSPYELQRSTGVPQPTIHRILTGESGDPRTKTLEPLADYFGFSVAELRDRDLANENAAAPASEAGRRPARPFDENVTRVPMGTRPIPVISSVQAGALRDMNVPYEPGDGYAVVYTDDMSLSRWTFSLEVEGESMLPRFQPGDLLIVDPELSPNPGNFVVARNGTNQATFKKYRPRGMDERGNMIFELVPLNEDYPTMRSDVEKLTILGVVVEHRNKLR